MRRPPGALAGGRWRRRKLPSARPSRAGRATGRPADRPGRSPRASRLADCSWVAASFAWVPGERPRCRTGHRPVSGAGGTRPGHWFLLLGYARSIGVTTAVADIADDNLASRRVVEKAGLHHADTFTSSDATAMIRYQVGLAQRAPPLHSPVPARRSKTRPSAQIQRLTAANCSPSPRSRPATGPRY